MCADPSCWQETARDPKGHFALQTPDLQPCSHAADNRGTLIKRFFRLASFNTNCIPGNCILSTMTIPLDQLNLDKTGSGAGVLSALATMAGGSTSHLFLGVRKLSRKSLEVNLSSVQMVSLFWGVPQKEISKVRAFNLRKKNRDKKEVSSGSYLSLLP